MAPSGTAEASSGKSEPSGLFAFSQAYISGEYQTITGACVPLYSPDQRPSPTEPTKGPVSRIFLSVTQPLRGLR